MDTSLRETRSACVTKTRLQLHGHFQGHVLLLICFIFLSLKKRVSLVTVTDINTLQQHECDVWTSPHTPSYEQRRAVTFMKLPVKGPRLSRQRGGCFSLRYPKTFELTLRRAWLCELTGNLSFQTSSRWLSYSRRGSRAMPRWSWHCTSITNKKNKSMT